MNHQHPPPEEPVREVTLEIVPAVTPEPPRMQYAETLSNLWTVFLGMKNMEVRTRMNWNVVRKRFCAFFQNAHMGDASQQLTPQGMVAWMEYLKAYRCPTRARKPLSPTQINRINYMTRAFLRWLKTMGYTNMDLASCIPELIPDPPKDPAIITEEEYEKIKAYCAGRDRVQVHLWLCILAYRTGMSLVDCCHLRWRDVHLDDNGPSYIDIRRIKLKRMGAKAKCQIPIVPMSDIHLWLLNLRKVEPWKRADGITDYVHQETPGLYASSISLSTNLKHVFQRAGLPPEKTFKCFRNSLCSNLVNSGMQLALVCKITGHNSVKTLLGYLKPDRRALEDGMAKAQEYSAIEAGVTKVSTGFAEEA